MGHFVWPGITFLAQNEEPPPPQKKTFHTCHPVSPPPFLFVFASSIHPTGNTRRRRQTERAAPVRVAPLGSTAQAVVAALQAHAQHVPTTVAVASTGPAAQGSAPAPV